MFAKAFGEWVVRWRWPVLVLSVAAVAWAASGGRFLTFTTDYRYFFSERNPQLAAFEALQNTYAKNDNVLIALAPKDGDVFTPETLAAVKALTTEGWQVPYSLRVDSLTNYQHTTADGDDLLVRDLVADPAALAPDDLKRVRRVALAEPLLVNRLVSPDARVTAVNVTIHLPGVDSTVEVPEVVAFVRGMVDAARADHPDIDFYLSGVVMMDNAFPEASQGDLARLVPLMYGVIILIMALLLRSVTGTLATVLVMAFSVLTAMGLTGWAGGKLTPPSASAPTIILTLGVAHSIHILVTMFHEMRAGADKRAAIVESMRINLQPVFLTSLTTVIGFLSMNFSDAPPFRDLGNIVAVGVAASFFFAVLFLPAFMAVAPVRVRPRPDGRRVAMDRMGEFVVRRRHALFWGMLGVIVLLAAGTLRLEVNDQFVQYFDDRYAFRTDTDFVTENLTGIYSVEYSLGAGQEGGIAEPDYLNHLEAFADWYRAQPEVMHVNVLTDVMKRLNKNLHGDDPAWYRIPDRRDLAAQYLLLYELSLPYGLDLNNQINVPKSATRMTVTLRTLTTRQTLDVEQRAQAWLAAHAPPSMQVPGASPTIMFTHIAKRNIKSMIGGTTLALVLISLILVLAVRSLKIGLVSLVPNLVPGLMAFGLWGLLVGKVGLGTSVVASISLGIVVDDTVHFLTKYLRARREKGLSAPEAVRYAYHTVGTALVITSVILVAGFSVLAFSGFALNAQMGVLTAIALAFALAADLLFLPPLLMRLEGDRAPEPAAAPRPASM
jgi:predicted RND superfamily exporter protein